MTLLLFAAALAGQVDHSQHQHHAAPAPTPHPALRMAVPTPAPAPLPDPHAGHRMPAPAQDPHAGHNMPAPTPAPDPHAGHNVPAPTPAPDPHAGHAMGHGSGGTSLPAGQGAPPPPPADHWADRSFDPAAMAAARERLTREHGAARFATVTFNLAEYQARQGKDGYRWDGELWYGGDINRFVLRTEGEGAFGEGVEEAEVQALYSRALDAYWNLQAGVRVDAEPNGRAYAVLGVEGLAPYWFDVESAIFLSEKGDLLARVQATYDQRITQRLIAQPFLEANFALQDVPRDRIGSGLSDLELGLRVRYEIAREFAPYVGVTYERAFGDTARYARATGEDPSVTAFVFGIRAWF
jgi:copper resistance protein B